MNINNMFPSNYIKALDLNGKAMLVTIDSVTEEVVGNDTKPVVYFRGAKKGLVLNKTNAQMIATKYGPETDGWAGSQIELYPDKTNFQGQVVDCLRVRIPVPRAEDEPEEIPF